MSLNVDSVRNVKFQTPNFTSKEKMVYEPDIKCENNSNALQYTLVGLGALALGALGAAMALKKGNTEVVTKPLAEGANNALEALKKLKNIDVDTFKSVGKFEKGKATIDGQGFSGVIHNSNGSKMIYEDGNLLKSELANRTVKTYEYQNDKLTYVGINAKNYNGHLIKAEDGSISISKQMKSKNTSDRRGVWYDTNVSSDGKLSKVKIEQFNKSHPNYKKGKEIPLKKTTDLLTGKTTVERRVPELFFYRDWYTRHAMVDGKKVSATFDARGDFKYAVHSSFNPKTGIITKQHYKMENGKLVPTNKFTQMDKKSHAELIYEVAEDGKKNLLSFSDNYNGRYNPKGGNWCDGSRCWENIDDINSEIKRMGLQFDL